MLRPAVHAALEEGAVDDQLTAALEQVEQARFALGPVENICLFHGNPRHPPSLGGQRVTGAGQGLLLDEKLLARSLPLWRQHNRRGAHGGLFADPVILNCLGRGHGGLRIRRGGSSWLHSFGCFGGCETTWHGPFDRCELQMWRDVYGRRMQSRVSVTFDVLAVHEIPSTEPATVPFDPTAVNLDPLQTMPHHDGSLQGGCRAQQCPPRTRQSLPHARGNAFALFRAADRLGIYVQQDAQMNPMKNKAERSHTFPREVWPILALIFTGPVLL